MNNEVDNFLEQLDAAYHVAHHYTCIVCRKNPGAHPKVIIQDLPDGGCRAVIVVVCDDCTLTDNTEYDIIQEDGYAH